MYKLFLALLFNFLSIQCYAQSFLEPVVGYGYDLNNGFKHVNTAVQFSRRVKNDCDFLLKLERGWGFSSSSQDSSFTLNPSLPLYANADKRIRPTMWTLATGLRLKLAGAQTKDVFSILMYAGLSYQKMKVEYQYNKGDYTILNPDKTGERLGAMVSGGIEYMRLVNKGRLIFQVLVATPPTGRKRQFPTSYSFVAPLTFNAGYAIPFAKS